MMKKQELKALEAKLYTIQCKISNVIGDYPSITMELNQANDFIEKARQEVQDKIDSL